MYDVKCPYCREEIIFSADDTENMCEFDTFEHECPGCRKFFIFELRHIPVYEAFQADCLNGAAHNYQKIGDKLYRCRVCGLQTNNTSEVRDENSNHRQFAV